MSADEAITYGAPEDWRDEDAVLERDARIRRRRRRELAALGFLAALLGFIIWWILTYTVIVPDVVGLDSGEATIRLTAAKLQVGDVRTVRSTRFRAGEIESQGPLAGRRALRGAEVDLAVARQAARLTGSEDASASASEDYVAYSTTEWDPWESRTNVQPAPRTYSKAFPGDVVPMVQALSEKKAVSALKSAGYKVDVKRGPNSSGPGPGKVFFQYPSAFSEEPRGSSVEIWVSTGGPDTGRVCPVPREPE